MQKGISEGIAVGAVLMLTGLILLMVYWSERSLLIAAISSANPQSPTPNP